MPEVIIMNNLFLSGNIQIGKSTFLRDKLTPYRDALGGFSSQRLLGEDGQIMGYRLTDASDFEIERLYDPSLSDIFITHSSDNEMIRDISVFETAAGLLIPSAGTAVMLLDEIGGIELCSDLFRLRLFELLSSETPCIGVIKSCGGSMDRENNMLLRDHIMSDSNSAIIELYDSDRLYGRDAGKITDSLEKAVRSFIEYSVSLFSAPERPI